MKKTNEMNTAEEELLPFDLIVVVQDVLKRGLLIALVAVLVGIGAYIQRDTSYKPVYQSTATFVVTTRSSNSNVYTDLTSTTNLAAVFSDLINSSIMRKAILKETGQQIFDGTINAAAIPETNLLTMTVKASDPRTAFLVAKAIVDHHETITYQVVDGIALEVLQNPVVPAAPVNYSGAAGMMKRMTVLAAAAMVALLAFISFRRNAVRSGTEARKKLDCSYLGEIPHEKKYKTLKNRIRRKKTSILITNPAAGFRFVESMRKFRRRVERHMHDSKVLMITSLLENEGKSTVTVNLALSLAQKHAKVLLIDCDLRKPACHLLLEKKIQNGLRDVLSGKASCSDVMIRDKKSKLYLLLETKGNSNSGNLLSGEKMQDLLTWARREFDYVVLDLPPMAVVSDAETMMEYADASLLVVRQNAAVAPAINKAIATLEKGKAELLGCVLNNVYSTNWISDSGYGYGRYNYYGRYNPYAGKSSGKAGK